MSVTPVNPEICPVCGSPVRARALACPHCGADEQSGWDEESTYSDGLDLPDSDDFNYDRFLAREFGDGPDPGRDKPIGWRIVALVVAVILILLTLLGVF